MCSVLFRSHQPSFLRSKKRLCGRGITLLYSDMCVWSRDFDLLHNRVSIVNQLLGYGIDGCSENPFGVRYAHGTYSVVCAGSALCSFGVWDCSGLSSALSLVDHWADCLWRVGCLGFLSPAV